MFLGFVVQLSDSLKLLNTTHIYYSNKKVLYEVTLCRAGCFIVKFNLGKTKSCMKR